jgi:hypothetical protein
MQLVCELSDGIVEKKDDAQGGRYCINLTKAIGALQASVLESIVKERFGSQCCRMYRMAAEYRNVEERQVGPRVLQGR